MTSVLHHTSCLLFWNSKQEAQSCCLELDGGTCQTGTVPSALCWNAGAVRLRGLRSPLRLSVGSQTAWFQLRPAESDPWPCVRGLHGVFPAPWIYFSLQSPALHWLTGWMRWKLDRGTSCRTELTGGTEAWCNGQGDLHTTGLNGRVSGTSLLLGLIRLMQCSALSNSEEGGTFTSCCTTMHNKTHECTNNSTRIRSST